MLRQLLSNESNCNQFILKTYELSGFLHLDIAALKALHVEPTDESRRTAGKERNLYSLLDKCATAQGKRMLSQWLRQPLMDINKIGEIYFTFSKFSKRKFGNNLK